MSMIGMNKEDPNKMKANHYGKRYRWVFQNDHIVRDDAVMDGATSIFILAGTLAKEANEKKDYDKIPDGTRFMLQLNLAEEGKEKLWTDWLYLAKSTIEPAGIGVYAARRFEPGELIGLYSGESLGAFGKAGGCVPPDSVLQKVLPRDKVDGVWKYGVFIRFKDGVWNMICPDMLHRGLNPEEPTMPSRLGMGLHFMNDCVFHWSTWAKEEKKKANRSVNAIMEEDGFVFATKQIETKSEIFITYEMVEYKKMHGEGKED